jgi:hemoglobin
MRTLYAAAGGAAGMRRLAEAWHARVLEDEVVAHAFSHGIDPHHVDRLAAYWGEALGGPPVFTARLGDESAVVRLHSGNGAHRELDQRAIACFDAAMADVGLDDPVVRGALHDYFVWSTTVEMARYPETADAVPAGLPLPRWSWDGLVPESAADPRP